MLQKRWHQFPANFRPEFNFHKGPFWLRALARTPILERFAYPIAMKKGLCELWPSSSESILDPNFDATGWVIHTREKNDLERWIEGSLAYLAHGERNRTQQFFFRDRMFRVKNNQILFRGILPRFSFTSYGGTLRRQRGIHRANGTYKKYKKAFRGENFDFSE